MLQFYRTGDTNSNRPSMSTQAGATGVSVATRMQSSPNRGAQAPASGVSLFPHHAHSQATGQAVPSTVQTELVVSDLPDFEQLADPLVPSILSYLLESKPVSSIVSIEMVVFCHVTHMSYRSIPYSCS